MICGNYQMDEYKNKHGPCGGQKKITYPQKNPNNQERIFSNLGIIMGEKNQNKRMGEQRDGKANI